MFVITLSSRTMGGRSLPGPVAVNVTVLPADAEQTFKIMLTAASPGSTPVMARLSTSDLEGPLQEAEAVIVEADNP